LPFEVNNLLISSLLMLHASHVPSAYRPVLSEVFLLLLTACVFPVNPFLSRTLLLYLCFHTSGSPDVALMYQEFNGAPAPAGALGPISIEPDVFPPVNTPAPTAAANPTGAPSIPPHARCLDAVADSFSQRMHAKAFVSKSDVPVQHAVSFFKRCFSSMCDSTLGSTYPSGNII
jgi:hypothetical protein